MEEAARSPRIGTLPLIIRPPTPSAAPAAASPTTARSSRTIGQRPRPLARHEVLIEESLLGWKEFEMEVMRDKADNCVIICSIENLDPMGVHTGDSITVAPIQTLTDANTRSCATPPSPVIREIGVETGGSNIQFAVIPTRAA
jgi:carbamoyl-phosphate synthase large subunit